MSGEAWGAVIFGWMVATFEWCHLESFGHFVDRFAWERSRSSVVVADDQGDLHSLMTASPGTELLKARF